MEMTAAKRLLALLKARGETLTGAESLTGGLVADTVVSVPGASAVFKEAFVTYCDEAKAKTLGVPAAILRADGAISSACAGYMAEGAARAASADMAYATTGNAGPDAAEGKPVGLVYIAVSYRGRTETKELHLSGDRASIREQSAEEVLRLCTDAAERI